MGGPKLTGVSIFRKINSNLAPNSPRCSHDERNLLVGSHVGDIQDIKSMEVRIELQVQQFDERSR